MTAPLLDVPPLLEVRGLNKIYRSGGGFLRAPREAQVVKDVGFTVGRGEVFGLVGESGSGKTTIGRMLLRLTEADSGEILFDGQDVRGLSPAALRGFRRRAQMIFQDPFASLDPRVRVGDAIAAPIRLH